MNAEIAGQLVMDIANLHSRISKRIGGPLSLHGLGLTDYFVLHQLSLAPQQRLPRGELAERVGLTPSGVTRLLNPLAKIGLVEKESNPRDARVSLVALSAAGKRTYAEAKVSFHGAAQEFFAAVDANERARLRESLDVCLFHELP